MSHFQKLPGLAEAWAESSPGERVRKLRRAAEAVRERLVSEGPALAVKTCKLVTFPYPASFAFSGGALSIAPYVMLTNAMTVVQWEQDGQIKTLLFNPSDIDRNKQATFYLNLRRRYGEFFAEKVFATYHGTVESHLERLSLRPTDIDYIAYDHLHVQDIRRWLGGDGPAYFSKARLIVHRREWQSVKDLHPMNRVWYVPGGVDGVPDDRVVLIDEDIWLGKGVAIICTPGHTLGNMSLVVVTDRGPFVISENGVATESYTPLHSRIPGVRRYAEQMGYEVVMNGNTRESSLDQYASMIVEKVIAGPSRDNPSYVNFYPSSELTASPLSPLLAPTFSHPPPEFGTIRAPKAHGRTEAA